MSTLAATIEKTPLAINSRALSTSAAADVVSLRRIPYPYRSLLAICSDLDETPDREMYFECSRYLNTTRSTSMGPGVGLEVGNTIYFDMPPDQFSYWNTDDTGRSMVRELIRSGHIDCLHSFGDLATSRADAGRALDDLVRYGCRLEVWIDHRVAPSNFGGDIMQGRGDVEGSEVYHADLTCAFGIRFVWRGRVTSVIGQDAPPTVRGLIDARHPFASARTAAKEMGKRAMGWQGGKYAMHTRNRILGPARLRSRQRVIEFLRCNPHWGGVSCGETASGIGHVLTEKFLTRLAAREATCILYTHLGKIRERRELFDPAARAAFTRLADHEKNGRVLVTTTHRLLKYNWMTQQVRIRTEEKHGLLHVNAETSAEASRYGTIEDWSGLTIYVQDPRRTTFNVDGVPVRELQRNAPDHTGRPSVSIPWRRLEYPAS